MAEAGAAALLSPKCSHHNQHRLSLFPNKNNNNKSLSFATAFPCLKLRSISPLNPYSSISSSSDSSFQGTRLVFAQEKKASSRPYLTNPQLAAVPPKAQMSSIGIIGKAQRWWEKGLQPNMKEIEGAQDLVDSLLNAGDKLVIVDFFSPGCGGCKALHPKICQLAEQNPDVQFLQVNYEEHKSMCYALNVHVLPFFRFYRGAHGRLCSFSCTNATIKKFKDALAKYGADFCSLEPTKGLEEKELLALAANRDLSFNYTPKPQPSVVPPEQEDILTEEVADSTSAESERAFHLPLPLPLPLPPLPGGDKRIVPAGR